jgi:hypothetical protein
VSVTPKIVNWGFYGEGGGEADISSSEITDWNGLAALLLDNSKFANDRNTDPPAADLVDELKKYAYNQRAIPYQLRSKMLKELNKYQRSDLFGYPVQIGNEIMFEGCVDGIREVVSVDVIEDCNACNWKPENCTIDMSLVVRLSDANSMRVTLDDTPDAISVNFEDNVRAIANTIQIRSGEGVVMAGLIGDRELDQQNKVPILGDLPYVGFLFRSKEVLRQKTEVLIFLEAQVLDPVAPIARAQSSEDFMLSQDYVDGPLLDNALEVGINRVGIGSYLPPARKHECIYWERHGRKIQKMATHVDDIIVK